MEDSSSPFGLIERRAKPSQYLADSDFLLSSYETASTDIKSFDIQSFPCNATHQKPIANETDMLTDHMSRSLFFIQYQEKMSTIIKEAMSSHLERNLQESDGSSKSIELPDIEPPPNPRITADILRLPKNIGTRSIPSQHCRNKLRHATAKVCRSVGFSETSEIAMDCLAGACETFYNRLMESLKTNVDQLASQQLPYSQTALSIALSNTGLGNAEDILQYYKDKTLYPCHELYDRCSLLYGVYKDIKDNAQFPETTFLENIIKLDEESSDEEPTVVEEENEAANATDGYDHDDAQQLLALAGLSGFDIKLEGDEDETAGTSVAADTIQEVPETQTTPATNRKKKGLTKNKNLKRKR